MRILCVGIWGLPSGVTDRLTTAAIFQDYDAVVVDPLDLEIIYRLYTSEWYRSKEKRQLKIEAGHYIKAINEIRSREVEGLLELGGVLICFMRPLVTWSYGEDELGGWERITNYGWLGLTSPFEEYIDSLGIGHGDTIDFIDQNHEFAAYLRNKPPWTTFARHEYHSYWKVLASAFGTNDVALTRRQGRGHIVFLPSGTFAGSEELLESCIKNLLREREPREKPTWVREIMVPQQKEILEKIEHADGEIEKLRKATDKFCASNENLERWKWLLWETGRDHLEPVVREALARIGCKVEPEPVKDSDGRVESEFGIALLEVEGTVGGIMRDKLGQLVVNIGNFLKDKGTTPKGIFVGNPFREEPLSNRPPKGTQKRLFAKELIEDAENQNITVLLSTDLYDIVCGILDGRVNEDKKKELRQAIFGGKGLVRLH